MTRTQESPSKGLCFSLFRAGILCLWLLPCLCLGRDAAGSSEQTGPPLNDPPALGAGAVEPMPSRKILSAHEVLFRANQDYLQGRYEEAAQGYESLLSRGEINGHVLYNLGNAYLRNGELGRAILHYRKALLLLPRDGDLKANLAYARSLRLDRLEPESEARSTLDVLTFWYRGMNLKEFLITFLVFHSMFWAVALLRLYRPSEALSWAFALLLAASALAAGSAAFKWRETLHGGDGVVLTKEVQARAGFTERDTVLFVLHEGAEFSILGEEAGWWKIELADRKKGWIPARSGGRVSL